MKGSDLQSTVLLVFMFSLNRYKVTVDQFEQYPQIKEFVLRPEEEGWLTEYCESLLSVNIEDTVDAQEQHDCCMLGLEDLKQFLEIYDALYSQFQSKVDGQGIPNKKDASDAIKEKII